MSTLSSSTGIIAPGDLSDFILKNMSRYKISYTDDAGKKHEITKQNFMRSPVTVFAEGISIDGNAQVDSFTEKEFKKFGLTATEIKGLRFVSKNEGKFNAINSYDTAIFSYGFIQMAGGGRSFHKFLWALKKDDEVAFHANFGKYGIDVIYDTDSKKYTTAVMNSTTGSILYGTDAEKHLKNDPRFLSVFMKAGHNKKVQNAQLSVASNEYVKPMRYETFVKTKAILVIKLKKDKSETTYVGTEADEFKKSATYISEKKNGNIIESSYDISGQTISDYWSGAKSVTAMIDRSIHQGRGGAKNLFTKATVKFIIKEKMQSLEKLKTAPESKFLPVLKETLGVVIKGEGDAKNAKDRIQKIIDNSGLSW